MLYKTYLEFFYKFCSLLDGTRADGLLDLKQTAPPSSTLSVLLTELFKKDRPNLFPHCSLYPEGLAQLAQANDCEQVKNVTGYYPEYKLLFEDVGSNKTLGD